jgi:hypothetical protein
VQQLVDPLLSYASRSLILLGDRRQLCGVACGWNSCYCKSAALRWPQSVVAVAMHADGAYVI